MMTDERKNANVTPKDAESAPQPPRNGRTASQGAAAGDVLESRLREAYRRRAAFHLGRGVGWLVLCLVGLIFLDLALDSWLELNGFFRLLLLAGNLAALAWVALRVVAPHLRRYDAVRTALQVEKAHPEINSLLVSAVQFRRGAMAPAHSEDLVQVVETEAADRVRDVDQTKIADFRRIRPILIGGAVALVALLLAVGIWPGHMGVLGLRMINPFSTARYPTDTEIYAATGDSVVRQNAGLLVEASARPAERVKAATEGDGNEPGVLDDKIVPPEALLWVEMGNGWESITVEREENGRYSYAFPQVYRDFEYYFEIGDAKSLEYDVNVVEPPRVEDSLVQFQYPEYVHVDLVKDIRTLNVKVPEGTVVKWTLTLAREVQNPVLNIEGREPLKPVEVNSEPGSDRVKLIFSAPATASASYALEFDWTLSTEDGRNQQFHERGPRHFLRVIPDNAPSVALTYPARDLKATLAKDMVLEYRASDDYGLEEAWLIYALNEQQEQRLQLGKLANGQTVIREIEWNMNEQMPDLREGDIVTFSVEVSDGRPDDEASRGRSRSRRVQFVSEADYLAYLMAQQRKFLGRIRPLYRHELEASTKMQDLSRQAAGDEKPAPRTTEEGQ